MARVQAGALASLGVVMRVFHWSPRDVEDMSLWELAEYAELARLEREA